MFEHGSLSLQAQLCAVYAKVLVAVKNEGGSGTSGMELLDEALEYSVQAVESYRRLENRTALCNALHLTAQIHHLTGTAEAALRE